MPDRSIPVTLSVPVSLDEEIRNSKEEYGMNYSEYIRHCVREHESNNAERPNVQLGTDGNGEVLRDEGAA
ncbi:CopG family transcriptional regulator [Halosimplex amylolyticum]|uniref:CopG family transcriptional regulator n=1 Tax=Halosimplex amylolyticum TaxID=3396616 RepID=UPI003F57C3D6